MENVAQTSRPDARIIHLRIPETLKSSERYEVHQPTMTDLHTLEYIDQLLEEHFK